MTALAPSSITIPLPVAPSKASQTISLPVTVAFPPLMSILFLVKPVNLQFAITTVLDAYYVPTVTSS